MNLVGDHSKGKNLKYSINEKIDETGKIRYHKDKDKIGYFPGSMCLQSLPEWRNW